MVERVRAALSPVDRQLAMDPQCRLGGMRSVPEEDADSILLPIASKT